MDDRPRPPNPASRRPHRDQWLWAVFGLGVLWAIFLARVLGGWDWGTALTVPIALSVYLALMFHRVRSLLTDPQGGLDLEDRATARKKRIEEEQRAYAKVMRELAKAPAPPPPEPPLIAFAHSHGLHVVNPLVIAGDRSGVRIAIERSATEGAGVSLEVDARHATAETLASLREQLEPSGYQLVRVGPNVRIEWRERDAVELDAERLDDVLHAVVDACSPGRGGAYR